MKFVYLTFYDVNNHHQNSLYAITERLQKTMTEFSWTSPFLCAALILALPWFSLQQSRQVFVSSSHNSLRAYLIYDSFGTFPHYKSLTIVHQKCVSA